jgi:hypothetical protein
MEFLSKIKNRATPKYNNNNNSNDINTHYPGPHKRERIANIAYITFGFFDTVYTVHPFYATY